METSFKQQTEPCGAHDFDFFHGSWQIRHRRLKERLAGCTEWQEFGGNCTTRPLLGGLGNVDDNIIHLPDDPYRAITLRTFDAQEGCWSIWWLDGRHPQTLDTPMRGRSEHGIGRFFCDDVLNGKPITVRFLWTHTPTGPRWEQAFSDDGGLSWETNWIMDFSKQEGTDSGE